MYQIKQKPEDFIVKEKINYELKETGEYTYFWMTKKNYDTLKALQQISKITRISLRYFSFAGNKDKQAITTQLCSVKGNIKNLQITDIEIKILGKSNKPVSLGTLEGNNFEIIVRNIDELPQMKTKFINYFGEQRFSTNNAEIGKAIIKKEWKTSAELMNHKEVKEALDKGKDGLTSIKTLPKKILKLYISAYQSKLWNKTVEENKNNLPEEIPIIGFGTKTDDKIKEVLNQEEITTRSFIIKEIPEISSEGTTRKTTTEAQELEIGKLEEDELNQGKKKLLLKFFLPKGSYATEFIKQNFSN